MQIIRFESFLARCSRSMDYTPCASGPHFVSTGAIVRTSSQPRGEVRFGFPSAHVQASLIKVWAAIKHTVRRIPLDTSIKPIQKRGTRLWAAADLVTP
jgi:hypothetical protein